MFFAVFLYFWSPFPHFTGVYLCSVTRPSLFCLVPYKTGAFLHLLYRRRFYTWLKLTVNNPLFFFNLILTVLGGFSTAGFSTTTTLGFFFAFTLLGALLKGQQQLKYIHSDNMSKASKLVTLWVNIRNVSKNNVSQNPEMYQQSTHYCFLGACSSATGLEKS